MKGIKKSKYVYNPQTLRYEAVHVPLKNKFFRALGVFCGVLIAGFVFYYGMDKIIQSPQEKMLKSQLYDMTYHIQHLANDYKSLSEEINNLHEKDGNVHRIIFGMEPIDENVWEGGVGGVDAYSYISQNKNAQKLLQTYLKKAEQLKHQVNLQKQSLDTLESLARIREDRLASIPSIKPVREDKLKRSMRSLSGYGIRIHPVHGVKKFHKGIDFTAPSGTDVVATGNGKVVRVEHKKVGYGSNIIIDHGFSYQTLYAHMADVHVKVGETVIKGQAIGTVGNTGTSTAPHLHYEVRLNGKAINPLDYCLDGLSPEEYQELVHNASIVNQSFD